MKTNENKKTLKDRIVLLATTFIAAFLLPFHRKIIGLSYMICLLEHKYL